MEARTTADSLNDRGCINLLCAMVKQMSQEFRYTYGNHLKDPENMRAFVQYNSVRDEFLSDYFSKLTGLNGRIIVNKLENIVEQCVSCCD